MQADKDILGMVVNRFPEYADSLTMLFYKDENFKEVCEDYFLCKEAMNKIIITNTRKRKILKEYKTTLGDLEVEMLMYLDAEIKTYGE